MLRASCVLLLAVVTTHQHVFTYFKPWDPFQRSLTECEMCYKGDCILTHGPRCEYYADATRLLSDDVNDDDDKEVEELEHREKDKIDDMIFELVDSASSGPHLKACLPLVSQYTDCTEGRSLFYQNICIGCKFCSCNEEGRWICSEKQKCRPEPKLNLDHRIIGIVIENLKRKEKTPEKRVKRSANKNTMIKNIKGKLTYTYMSKWLYGVEPFNEQKNVNMREFLKHLEDNKTRFDEKGYKDQVTPTITIGPGSTPDTSINKSENYVDLLEFNDILESWTNGYSSTKKPFTIPNYFNTFAKHRYEEIHAKDVSYSEYDPIRLIKRETSNLGTNESQTELQINSTSNNVNYELVFGDAVEGLIKITNEKQKELEELLDIQTSLLTIAKAHNIAIDMNSTTSHDDNHIAIYKLDTFEKCVAKVKHDICSAIADVIKTDSVSNSSELQRDLKLIFSTIRKYMLNEKVNPTANILSSHEYDEEPQTFIEPDNSYRHFNPIKHLGNILAEVNKVPGNPLRSLSQPARKIVKRVIKQLYLDDFAVIDYVVHETYYDFDSYMENIGTKWNKMMQDVTDSEVFDTLYKVKLLHMTLKSDISKMEDMITLLDFARNRRMTITNDMTIDKSILRIQNNLQLIDSNVQKIIKLEKSKKLRQASAVKKNKPAKKNSILQKLKKMFQNSKNDIKKMLRKRFPKSEIIKRIAKKKVDELETRRMLDYQETMKQWQDNLNEPPGREKRSAWVFQALGDRLKSIIPGYLRGKVKHAMHKKKGNKTQTTKRHESKKKRHTRPTTMTMTTTTTVSRNSTES